MGRIFMFVLGVAVSIAMQAIADEGEVDTASNASWTGGGKQFWSDYLVQDSWRIQRNVYTGHYRLLDANNGRHTWGSFAHCRREFESHKLVNQLKAPSREVVITLHGLGRTRDSMSGLGKYLADECGYTWINVSYASTRGRIESHAKALASVVSNLEGVEKVHFVAHSMGNLVVRHYLADRNGGIEGEASLPAIGRIVMLAPPNSGSHLAERFKDNDVFRIAAGVSGAQIAENWDDLAKALKTPNCEFGIIAGKTKQRIFGNPLLDGDDDLVVAVDETKLDGATDFLVVPVIHTFIMNDERVRQSTKQFLEHGFFISEEKRSPLPSPDEGGEEGEVDGQKKEHPN